MLVEGGNHRRTGNVRIVPRWRIDRAEPAVPVEFASKTIGVAVDSVRQV